MAFNIESYKSLQQEPSELTAELVGLLAQSVNSLMISGSMINPTFPSSPESKYCLQTHSVCHPVQRILDHKLGFQPRHCILGDARQAMASRIPPGGLGISSGTNSHSRIPPSQVACIGNSRDLTSDPAALPRLLPYRTERVHEGITPPRRLANNQPHYRLVRHLRRHHISRRAGDTPALMTLQYAYTCLFLSRLDVLTNPQVLEARIPGTDTTVKQHPKDDLGHGATVEEGDGTVKSGSEAMEEGQQKKGNMINRGAVSRFAFAWKADAYRYTLLGRSASPA